MGKNNRNHFPTINKCEVMKLDGNTRNLTKVTFVFYTPCARAIYARVPATVQRSTTATCTDCHGKKKKHTHPASASLILIKVSKAALISWKCQGTFSKTTPSLETAPERKALVDMLRLSQRVFVSPLRTSSNRSAPVVTDPA